MDTYYEGVRVLVLEYRTIKGVQCALVQFADGSTQIVPQSAIRIQ